MAKRTQKPGPQVAASEAPRKGWTPKIIGDDAALMARGMDEIRERAARFIDPVKAALIEQISKLLAGFDNASLVEFLGTLAEIMKDRAEARVPKCPPQEHWDKVAARNKAPGEGHDA